MPHAMSLEIRDADLDVPTDAAAVVELAKPLVPSAEVSA